MGLTVNRLAFSLTPNSTMETSGAKRKMFERRQSCSWSIRKTKKMWSKPFDAPLHISENDEEDIDELYRNEIVIEDN